MTALVKADTGRQRPPRRLPAEPGIWLFIFGDLLVFGYIYLVYLNYWHQDKEIFSRSQRELSLGLGIIYTVLLLTSSLFMATAMAALRDRDRARASRFAATAFACGAAFALLKAFEYHNKIDAGITPETNHFFLFYFILTGTHLMHLLIGLTALIFFFAVCRQTSPISPLRMKLAEGCGCFWHMVDMIWITIFPLVYLAH